MALSAAKLKRLVRVCFSLPGEPTALGFPAARDQETENRIGRARVFTKPGLASKERTLTQGTGPQRFPAALKNRPPQGHAYASAATHEAHGTHPSTDHAKY